MINETAIWLILLLPLASFAVNALAVRPLLGKDSEVAAYSTIGSLAIGFALSLWALASVINAADRLTFEPRSWLEVGNLEINFGILMAPLTAVMLVVVTGVSLMVQVYSTGYMKGDPGYVRYFAFMSLFSASMVGLVLASNIVQLYIFWELVGLCSYLLIGFWYERPAAAAAAKKAFIMTRLGDFGFLLAILYLVSKGDSFTDAGFNPLEITDVYKAVAMGGVLTTAAASWIAIGIFAGAVGKSAQFPLHTWLPDAMEGPTPVSALIHAATMVAAGVFLVARFFPIFELSNVAMDTVALIGGGTALFAASMGLVSNDIKRVLAYSTMSQLGFMMLALGVGAYGPAIFHLFTHAFFKALLFLGAGSVNHASGTFDMRHMGGLRRHMPWTFATFLIAGLSLAGIFPLAGFWSKDELLAHAFGGGGVAQVVFWLGIAAAFMTAFYIFRAIFMTFTGEFRGGADAEEDPAPGAAVHLGESPRSMVWPLAILAVPAVLAGFVNPVVNLGVVPVHWLSDFLNHGPVHVEAEKFDWTVAALSTGVAVVGVLLAFVMYGRPRVSVDRTGKLLRPAHVLLTRKYYFDEAYERYLVVSAFYDGVARFLDWLDKTIVDGFVRLVDRLAKSGGRAVAQLHSGQLQGYGIAVSVGVLGIFGVYFLFR